MQYYCSILSGSPAPHTVGFSPAVPLLPDALYTSYVVQEGKQRNMFPLWAVGFFRLEYLLQRTGLLEVTQRALRKQLSCLHWRYHHFRISHSFLLLSRLTVSPLHAILLEQDGGKLPLVVRSPGSCQALREGASCVIAGAGQTLCACPAERLSFLPGFPHWQAGQIPCAPIPDLIDKKEYDKIERKRRVRNERTKT